MLVSRITRNIKILIVIRSIRDAARQVRRVGQRHRAKQRQTVLIDAIRRNNVAWEGGLREWIGDHNQRSSGIERLGEVAGPFGRSGQSSAARRGWTRSARVTVIVVEEEQLLAAGVEQFGYHDRTADRDA